jgi:hypothetical protein
MWCTLKCSKFDISKGTDLLVYSFMLTIGNFEKVSWHHIAGSRATIRICSIHAAASIIFPTLKRFETAIRYNRLLRGKCIEAI